MKNGFSVGSPLLTGGPFFIYFYYYYNFKNMFYTFLCINYTIFMFKIYKND